MRILIVEDEVTLLDSLASRLGEEGYSVDKAVDGEEATLFINGAGYDCILLDIMIPETDGITLLKKMRAKGNSTPVLLLTAKDGVQDRVNGLDAGADDYLVKPFSHEELSARLRALLRRNSANKTNILTFADLRMDLLKREVTRGTKVIPLAAKEFMLLEYLMRNPNRVLTRSQIIDHVWNFDFDNDTNVVNVYIRYLRTKIDSGHDLKLIHTIRSMGYILKEGQ
ncbi:DNA-binding response OmpR family regulator [Elusimicrobium posterum]|uniref:response regulator transcription factor n=1 Tax=Elusimicrobium posterum TaxID=3116653 RepID=UPI003C75B99E